MDKKYSHHEVCDEITHSQTLTAVLLNFVNG